MKLFSGFGLAAIGGAAMLLAGCSENVQSADLDRALDVTSETLTEFEAKHGGRERDGNSAEFALDEFAKLLATNLNRSVPPVHPDPLGVELAEDGAMRIFHDGNGSGTRDSGEKDLFKIEIDQEQNRLLATEDNGYTRERGFSGTSLLAGMVLGALLSRQRGAGIGRGAFRNRGASPKRSMGGSSASAKYRSGSGSHSSGK